MRILFHCWEYPPRGSGIGSYIKHMTTAFQALGHFTVVVTSHGDKGNSKEEFANGVVYRSYKLKDIGKPYVTDLVLQIAHKYRVDWIEGADHLGESANLLSCQERPPVFIKTHYNDVLHCSRYGHVHYIWQKFLIDLACWRYRGRLRREEVSLENADVLIAPCRRILDEMEGQGIKLPSQKWILPNPITPLAEWSNQETQEPTLLLVGRIDLGKGIAHLSKLITKLKRRYPALKLEIAGDDSYARFLGSTRKWLVRKLGSNISHVSFLGHFDQKNLDAAYSRAWVVIVPSGWDTFPTVVLESMVRGKAIVASPNGGMPEMLQGTDNPIADPSSFQFAEEVEKLFSDKKHRCNVGLSGRKKAISVYNPEKVVDDYLEKLMIYPI